jgi:hypothetical protein
VATGVVNPHETGVIADGLVIAATRFSAALQLGSPKFVSVPKAAASMVPSRRGTSIPYDASH